MAACGLPCLVSRLPRPAWASRTDLKRSSLSVRGFFRIKSAGSQREMVFHCYFLNSIAANC